jgi:UDP-3-O-[3-hydroxymyristoyl] glucosamine N-acyltransferase
MSRTAAALAVLVNGELRGAENRWIDGVASIEQAGPSEITYIQDEKHVGRLSECRAAAAFLPHRLADVVAAKVPDLTQILVEDPQAAFLTVLEIVRPQRPSCAPGVSPAAFVSESAQLGEGCYVGPTAVVGDDVVMGRNCQIHPGAVIQPGCVLGDEVVLHPHAVLYADVTLKNRVIIHAGAVIGADGFGYRLVNGALEKIPQRGTVILHDDVEIGAGATIDRAMIGATVVGAGTKIDNMVMIAHNCELGQHNVFASQVGLAGSCKTGDYVRLGGQVGVKDHVTMHTGSQVGAKGGVHRDIPPGETWIGYPATPEAEQKRLVFSLKRVPEMRDQLKALQKEVARLSAELAAAPPSSNLRAAG